jgi:sec-independent protein translocase protein TatC
MSDNREDTGAEPEEIEGGPVKTFLEHLEDLRWTLIKVVSTLVVAMMVCLIMGRQLVTFLTYPLRVASHRETAPRLSTTVSVHWGTNIIARFPRTNLSEFLPPHATNVHAFRLAPKVVDGSVVLALEAEEPLFSSPLDDMVTLKNYSPISAIMVAMKLALYGGFVLGLPFILYFIGQFVLPALKVNEKQFVLRAIGIGAFLFLLGMAFCYFIMLQVALSATVQFSQWLGFGADEWRAEDYITFVSMLMLVVGVSFELPIILLALVKVGLIDYRKLSTFRPYWVVLELVICAFLTPSGDPFTMLLMALPLHVLYEISTLIAWYWHRRDARKAALEAAP